MTGAPARCPTCGGPLPLLGAPCSYCAAASGSAVSLGGLAEAARRGQRDLDAGLPRVADELASALPGRVRVDRGGVLAGRRIRRLEVDLDERVFVLERQGARLRATIGEQNRGVVIRHDEVPTTAWLEALSAQLGVWAATQGGLAPAVRRLLGHS